MFSKILIANRGEIACRVMQTASQMGIKTVAVYSDADAASRHVAMADEAVHIGPAPVGESYLKGDVIIAAALKTGAQAIHPGYGFLSENPDFVEAVEAAGLTFIGPSAKAIRAMGLKDAAKALMVKAGVPVVPGYHGENQDAAFLKEQADEIGYPVLIKARAGGGGKGMRLVEKPADFASALESAAREGKSAFGDAAVLVEKFITSPRHIEVQVFGDSHGNVVHLFERDCSLQRRHQKVIEEAPAPGMNEEVRDAMTSAAVKAAQAIDYVGAGTIEFIVDGSGDLRADGFWFMEMNTRLQVEHPVTEAITGQDLVAAQLLVASGETLPFKQEDLSITGHAFEARLYAEDVPAGFLPATGHIAHLAFSDMARNDSGVRSGDDITPYYDPMIAKVITHAPNRTEALSRLNAALGETHVAGTVTNLSFLQALATHEGFKKGEVNTGLIADEIDQLTVPASLTDEVVAIAALAALKVNPQKDGWRLWGEASHAVSLRYSDEVLDRKIIISNAGAVRLTMPDGTPCIALDNVTPTQGGFSFLMEKHKRSMRVITFHRGNETLVSVHFNGNTFEFTRPDPLSGRGDDKLSASAVIAPMTGVVRLVNVSENSKVKAGERVIVIEAMKMEMALEAPRDGIVSAISCKVGQAVESGSILLQLEEDE
ncbi:acetyl/propionyl/methylcrotonyl-CoA carboxylase subunit alpha [Ahrensia marina]|uniref:3-methylcrotonyl-CoA carboxylase n=1 Tax=Ahrensia marina TaxID=1514904 RepID=A0A0N1J6L3_9HYPH|nr:acetyl/propionyl/methylcrotonyl-CoA carboxylase subunit alpha [Ahrensia marina]KPB02654.1 3-methylcrotonyl-CoA carboxylase [Ahrensia marina]